MDQVPGTDGAEEGEATLAELAMAESGDFEPDSEGLEEVSAPQDATLMDLFCGSLVCLLFEFCVSFLLAMVITIIRHGEAGQPRNPVAEYIPHIALGTSFCSLVVAWYYVCKRYGRSFAEGFAIKRPSVATVFGNAGLGVLLFVFACFFLRYIGKGTSMISEIQVDPTSRVVYMALLLLAPLSEEIWYRGFFLPVFRRRLGTAVAMVITVAWFTAAHYYQLRGQEMALVPIAALGLATTLSRVRTGSLVPPMIIHFAYNSMVVSLLVLMTIFTPGSFRSRAVAKPAVARTEKPTLDEMKQDLLGRSASEEEPGFGSSGPPRPPVWHFDRLEEFGTFDLVGEKETPTGVEYTVRAEFLGSSVGAQGTLTINYKKVPKGWVFESVSDNGTLKPVRHTDGDGKTVKP
ncbi:MAG: CPBP family intramembrane metalloprotease [Candidatus Sumerlaeaceae bacterium]|nr:CPBP family intramembrane metalloprotease [Candidatus Sumerlaeaceae bacterium]